jgi:hypothetical protein
MTDLQPANSGERPFRQELWNAAHYYLGGRTGIVLAAAAVLGAGAYLNWGWLAALGLAPVIISALPCAAMCALGLCMSGRSRASGANEVSSASPDSEAGDVQPLSSAPGDATTPTIRKDVKHGGTDCC